MGRIPIKGKINQHNQKHKLESALFLPDAWQTCHWFTSFACRPWRWKFNKVYFCHCRFPTI